MLRFLIFTFPDAFDFFSFPDAFDFFSNEKFFKVSAFIIVESESICALI